jgi:hypothetical protein
MRSCCVPVLVLATLVAGAASADDLGGAVAAPSPHEHHETPSMEAAPDDAATIHEHHHEISEPIGVMGAHMHPKGGFMFSYRYARMRMDGNRDGSDRVSTEEILMPGGSYMVAPTDMDMQMHMFGAMYAPLDWLTLMAMIPYVELSMDHRQMNGNRFEANSSGVGDLKLSGLFRLFETNGHHMHVNLGLSFPTGGIGHTDDVPVPMMGFQRRRLPYPMQIGSGTWDLLPGITYTGANDWLGWGAQGMGVVRFGENDHDYRLGHRTDATAWVTVPLRRWVEISARLAYAYQGNIHGADPSLNPAAVPTADPKLRRGHRIEMLGGLSIKPPWDRFGEHRFGVEVGAPVWQKLDGPQLGADWRVVAGWQLGF